MPRPGVSKLFCIKSQIQSNKQRAGLHTISSTVIRYTVWISGSSTLMMAITLPSMVALMQCFELIIIRHFFDDCKKLTMHTDMYDIQLHFQNFMRANSNWMVSCIWPAGRSLDTFGLT